MYVSDDLFARTATNSKLKEQVHSALVEHISSLASYIFLGRKPARPAQARWTGVPNVARFALALSLFHNLLEPLLGSLCTGADGQSDSKVTSMDADVGALRFQFQLSQKSELVTTCHCQ